MSIFRHRRTVFVGQFILNNLLFDTDSGFKILFTRTVRSTPSATCGFTQRALHNNIQDSLGSVICKRVSLQMPCNKRRRATRGENLCPWLLKINGKSNNGSSFWCAALVSTIKSDCMAPVSIFRRSRTVSVGQFILNNLFFDTDA